jgi:hypothetical protein
MNYFEIRTPTECRDCGFVCGFVPGPCYLWTTGPVRDVLSAGIGRFLLEFILLSCSPQTILGG